MVHRVELTVLYLSTRSTLVRDLHSDSSAKKNQNVTRTTWDRVHMNSSYTMITWNWNTDSKPPNTGTGSIRQIAPALSGSADVSLHFSQTGQGGAHTRTHARTHTRTHTRIHTYIQPQPQPQPRPRQTPACITRSRNGVSDLTRTGQVPVVKSGDGPNASRCPMIAVLLAIASAEV